MFVSRLCVCLCRRTSPKRAYSSETVGFIGLGNMGAPMASNLLKNGRKLVVYDIADGAVSQAVSMGASRASSPAEVGSQVSTVVTMLPAGGQVLDCYIGKSGLLSTVSSGSVLIDCSTIDRSTVKEVFSSAQSKGVTYLDAPVSGGVGAASKGALTFMVGGDKDACQSVTPLLECMGKAVVHCGESGTGQVAKLCNNMLLAIGMIGTSETIQLGINLGMDPKRLSDIINIASGRCWSSDTYNPCPGVMPGVPSSNNYQGGFGTSLMLKDLGLAMDAAADSHSTTILGAMATQVFRMMSQQGYSHKDFSSVFEFIEKHK